MSKVDNKVDNKQPIQQQETKEFKNIKEQLTEESKYLSKLMTKYYNNPNNQWKFEQLRRPDMLYWGGKQEKIRDDNDFPNRYAMANNKMIWVRDPEWQEIKNTERRIKTLQLQLKSVGIWEHIKNKTDFSNQELVNNFRVISVDEDEYEEDEE